MKTRVMFVLFILMLAALVTACAQQLPAPETTAVEEPAEVEQEESAAVEEAPAEVGGPVKDRDTLIMALGRAAPTLDPTLDSVPYNETNQMFDRLVELDPQMQLIPSIATEWRLVDDVTWEFKLQEGIKFHNGEDLTCEDVKFTLDRIMDPATESRQVPVYFSQVADSQCLDDFTFQVTTQAPFPAFVERFSFLRIVPKDTFEEMGPEQFGLNPVGSGPYKFVEWVQGDHLNLEAFEDHWRGAPPIKNVEIRNVTEPSTRLALLRSGEVDFIDDVPPCEAETIAEDPNLEVSITRSMNAIFIGMNSFQEPFDDIRVRQAMNYAVDWEAIMDVVLCGYAYRNPSSIGILTFGADPDLEPYPYDPEKAKELLAEAGYPDGFEVLVDGPIGRYARDKEVAEAVAGYLNEIGIQTQMNLNEWGTFWSRFLGKEIPGIYLLGCDNTVGGDFDLCNRLHFHSQVRGIYYNTPKVDALLDEEASMMDRAAREVKLKELYGVIKEEAPWIFAYDNAKIVGHRVGLNLEMRPDLSIEKVYKMSWE